MIHTILEVLIAAAVILGATLTFLAAVGLFRLPDLYTRMHAASKAGTAGSGLLLLAVAIQSGEGDTWIKCLLAIVFFFLTAPVSAHLLAKAAVRHGQALPPPEGDVGTNAPRSDGHPDVQR